MRLTRFDYGSEEPRELAVRIRALAPRLEAVSVEVASTLEAVKKGGDAAVLELGERFDGARPVELRVDPAQIEQALADAPPELADALRVATANIRAVAEAQLAEPPAPVVLAQGQTVTIRESAVSRAGMYVPGGRAAYPSSVLMCCIPALVAGVESIAVATPPDPTGALSEAVLAACAIAGVREVYAMGGAQAIAAFAFGTETVAAVDVIAGPGNRYVQEAKRQVFGRVGIDAIAGPSELMVIFDGTTNLEWLALDLCAQAEHGADGILVAVATKGELLEELAGELTGLAAERPSVSDAPLALVTVPDREAAIGLADEIAPEHLQLAVDDAEAMASSVHYAGCVFAGPFAGTAFGDYAAGSNHVLPTGGAGRFSGPLGPATFRRPSPAVTLPETAARALAPHVDVLARAEGFPVHGESARARE